jgi:hypothetical protein
MHSMMSLSAMKHDRILPTNDLIEYIRRCIRKRQQVNNHDEQPRQEQLIEFYSTIDYCNHLKRSIESNPLISQVLFRFYHLIASFSQTNDRKIDQYDQYASAISLFGDRQSTWHSNERIMLHSQLSDIDQRSNLSVNISSSNPLNIVSDITSSTHVVQPMGMSRQTGGLMTTKTQIAIHKVMIDSNEIDQYRKTLLLFICSVTYKSSLVFQRRQINVRMTILKFSSIYFIVVHVSDIYLSMFVVMLVNRLRQVELQLFYSNSYI